MKLLRSIRLQFFVILTIMSIMPFLLFSVYFFRNNQNFYNNQIEQASKSEVRRITSRINDNYRDAKNLIESLLLSTYDRISCMDSICEQEIIGAEVTKSARLINYRMFKYVCSNLLANAVNVDSVYLICENEHVYSYIGNHNYGLERIYQESDWYQQLISSKSSLEIASMADVYPKAASAKNTRFVVARKFQSVKGNHSAVLAVVCQDSMFEDVTDANYLPWGNLMIMDGEGNVLYGRSGEKPDKEMFSIAEVESGAMYKKSLKSAMIYGELDINDWIVAFHITFDAFYDSYIRNIRILFAFLCFVLVIILLGVFYMDRRHIQPIVRLAKIMETATEHSFLFHNEYEGRQDEIGELYAYFDRMMKKTERLIQEKYEIEIKILKSRLRNLTSQINAHFIFNTLENISSLAQIEGNKQIAVMSKALGDMLHYSMDFEGDFVRLHKEISHISQYLNIQEIRFGNKIDLSVDLEEDSGQRKVMKFMLQPIIENAIEHGMSEKCIPWRIMVVAKRDGEDLLIIIRDNGTGMDEETLEKVRSRIYESKEIKDEEKIYNIGLTNIHERIRLLFSGDYGLRIESKVMEGTTVTIRIPWM